MIRNMFSVSFSLLRRIRILEGSNTFADFDPVLACKSSAAIQHQTQQYFYMYLVSVLPTDLGAKYLYKSVLFLHMYFGLCIWD